LVVFLKPRRDASENRVNRRQAPLRRRISPFSLVDRFRLLAGPFGSGFRVAWSCNHRRLQARSFAWRLIRSISELDCQPSRVPMSAERFCVPGVCMGHLPWAREVLFQAVHSVSRFLSPSNNLGICSFARLTTTRAVSDRFYTVFDTDGIKPAVTAQVWRGPVSITRALPRS
jgi:hypothetical protein